MNSDVALVPTGGTRFGFYAAMSVGEVLLVDPLTREFELLGLAADGSYEPIAQDDGGGVSCHTLDVVFSVAAGPKFRVVSNGDVHEV